MIAWKKKAYFSSQEATVYSGELYDIDMSCEIITETLISQPI